MTEKVHTCAIGGCRAQIPTTMAICAGHREQISERSPSTLAKIDQQFVRRQQGSRGAALKYQEAVSAATAMLYEAPPSPRKTK